MATGLAVPIRPNSGGGFLTASGDENDRKIIKLSLGDDDNENAFQQDIGLGTEMVFDINDPVSRPRILSRLQAVFQRFEALKRYQLIQNTIRWTEGEGELILDFKYLNLETDKVEDFQRSFLQTGSGQSASRT